MAEDAGTAVVESPSAGANVGVHETPGGTAPPSEGGREGSAEAPPSSAPTARESAPAPTEPVRVTPERSPDGRFAPREATPPPAVSPEPDPVAQARDTLISNWRDLADPDIRESEQLKKYKTVGEALKGLHHLGELQGRSIQIPREGASDVQWRSIYEKLGCPASPSDYVVTDPDMGTDEDGQAKTLAPNFLVSLLDVAHRAGLNQQQAQEFVNFAARTVVQSEQIQAGEMAMQRAQAERELFEAFAGDAATMIQKATMAISRIGEGRYGGGAYAQRAAEKIRASHLGNDVDVIAAFANLWDNVSEGQFVESGAGGGLASRDQIESDLAQLATVMNNDKLPMDERVAAQKRHFQLLHDRIALDEAAERRSTGFRRA